MVCIRQWVRVNIYEKQKMSKAATIQLQAKRDRELSQYFQMRHMELLEKHDDSPDEVHHKTILKRGR